MMVDKKSGAPEDAAAVDDNGKERTAIEGESESCGPGLIPAAARDSTVGAGADPAGRFIHRLDGLPARAAESACPSTPPHELESIAPAAAVGWGRMPRATGALSLEQDRPANRERFLIMPAAVKLRSHEVPFWNNDAENVRLSQHGIEIGACRKIFLSGSEHMCHAAEHSKTGEATAPGGGQHHHERIGRNSRTFRRYRDLCGGHL